jgi:hypothetical protein
MAKNKNLVTYEAPKAEVIFIEAQSVFCGSSTNAGTGNAKMSNNTNVIFTA